MLIGTVIGQVDATDTDGLHNTISYSFQNSSQYFAINNTSGEIKTLDMLPVVANYSEVIYNYTVSFSVHAMRKIISILMLVFMTVLLLIHAEDKLLIDSGRC